MSPATSQRGDGRDAANEKRTGSESARPLVANTAADAFGDLLAMQASFMTLPWQMLGAASGSTPGATAAQDSAVTSELTDEPSHDEPQADTRRTTYAASHLAAAAPSIPVDVEPAMPATRNVQLGMPGSQRGLPPGWSVLNLAVAMPPQLNEVIYHLTMALQAATAHQSGVETPRINAWMDHGRPTITH
ncbi:MAG: hypothetical protein AAGG72_06560 [Pseudomonadota bacterium]